MRNIIYQAEVTISQSKQTYIGLCDTSFKSRYRNHTCSFRNERYRNSTELSKYVWGLKDKKVDYHIKWRIVRHARSYSNVTKKCNLCLWEKYYIICRPDLATLNSRNELVTSCRHAKKSSMQIIERAKPYNSASKRCNLCLLAKFIIIREPHRCTLNKRNELVST